jgi:hypothetical protein
MKEAAPFERMPVPSTVAPSKNCTEPVGIPGVINAVIVTAPPTNEGFHDDISVVVVIVLLTVCRRVADVLAA